MATKHDRAVETAEKKVRDTTAKMQERQEQHRNVVEKFIADDEKNRAKVDAAQQALADAVHAQREEQQKAHAAIEENE